MKKLYKRNEDTLSAVAFPQLFPPWLVSEEDEIKIVGNGFWLDGKHLEGMRTTINSDRSPYYHRLYKIEAMQFMFEELPAIQLWLSGLGVRNWRTLLYKTPKIGGEESAF